MSEKTLFNLKCNKDALAASFFMLDMIKGCLFTTAFFYEREHKKRARPYIRTRFFDFFPLPSDK